MSSDTMTKYSVEELKCPKCGRTHQIKKYSFINAVEKPGIKEDILKNRIFYFQCDNCKLEAPLTYNSIYADSKKRLVVCLKTEETDETIWEKWEQKKGLALRFVDNINDLKEKIMIAEKHLDDRVIELVKIEYLRQLEREIQNDTLMNILFDYHGDDMYFLLFFEKKGVGRLPLDMELYRKTESKYEKQIKSHSDDKFAKIDMEWAGTLFFKRN